MVEWPENVNLKDPITEGSLKFEIRDGAHQISLPAAEYIEAGMHSE